MRLIGLVLFISLLPVSPPPPPPPPFSLSLLSFSSSPFPHFLPPSYPLSPSFSLIFRSPNFGIDLWNLLWSICVTGKCASLWEGGTEGKRERGGGGVREGGGGREGVREEGGGWEGVREEEGGGREGGGWGRNVRCGCTCTKDQMT